MSPAIEISSPEKEGVLQVSKSRKLPVLIDSDEMAHLFEILSPCRIFDVSRPVGLQEGEVAKEYFLDKYRAYVDGIKQGSLIDETPLRPYFSSIITLESSAIFAQELANGKYLIKARLPAIQMQRHHFIISDTFHSGVMGEESITWGIQFSYPQLYLDPKTKEIGKVEKNHLFPNTELFHKLAKWVRDHTLATPFIFNGKKVNQPMRLGKNCFSWINRHPKLQARGVYVEARKNPSRVD